MKPAFTSTHRKLAVTWALLVVVCGILLAKTFTNFPVKTGLLDLIPQTETAPATKAAYNTLSHTLESQMVMLVGDPKKARAIRGADAMASALGRQSEYISDVTCRIDTTTQKQFFDTFFPARWTILSPENRSIAQTNDLQGLADKSMQRLYSVVSGVPSSLIEQDPFFLFEDLAFSLPKLTGAFAADEDHLILHENGMYWVLLSITGKENAFAGGGAAKMVTSIDRAIQIVRRQTQVKQVHWTGMAKYSAEASTAAQREVSIIGTGSIIGVVALLLLAFSSIRELFYGLIPIAIGLLAAVVATVLIFGQIHLITLVFGASLVGVCIDYSFHFFAHSLKGNATPDKVFAEVMPGITLGMLTSVAGYAALLIAPFPGLQQMAVFAGVGLIGAYGTVACWFPLLPFTDRPRRIPRLWYWTASYVSKVRPKHFIWCLLLCVPFGVAIPFLRANDDIRLLRGEFPALEREEKLISSKINTVDKSRFMVLWAPHEESLVQLEEKVMARLTNAQQKGAITGFVMGAQLIPSKKVQVENRRFLKQFTASQQARSLFDTMGWEPSDITRIRHSIDDAPLLQFDHVKDSKIAALYQKLRLGAVANQHVSVVLLQGIRDKQALQQVIKDMPNVAYVDKVETVTDLFTQYRQLSTLLVIGAYVVIFLFLVSRYGVKKGFFIIFPPLMTAIVLLGAMSILQIQVNIFTFLALLIVLAIGIDYTLFFAESRDVAPTTFAIVLSGITTILSFGLLSLSSNPALKTFGATVLAGIVMAMMLSPLANVKKQHAQQSK